jgi:hypothetical protein
MLLSITTETKIDQGHAVTTITNPPALTVVFYSLVVLSMVLPACQSAGTLSFMFSLALTEYSKRQDQCAESSRSDRLALSEQAIHDDWSMAVSATMNFGTPSPSTWIRV